MLGMLSQGVGLPVGVVLSLILIYVVNVAEFGWTIQFHLPLGFLAQSTLLIGRDDRAGRVVSGPYRDTSHRDRGDQ